MATIAAAPFLLKNAVLTIAADDYTAAVNSVSFTPSSSQVEYKAINGVTTTFNSSSTWTCEVSFAQDWASTNSLSKYLHANEGNSVVATFKPIAGVSAPTLTATITLTPGQIGGAVDSVAVATVTFGSTKPVLS